MDAFYFLEHLSQLEIFMLVENKGLPSWLGTPLLAFMSRYQTLGTCGRGPGMEFLTMEADISPRDGVLYGPQTPLAVYQKKKILLVGLSVVQIQ